MLRIVRFIPAKNAFLDVKVKPHVTLDEARNRADFRRCREILHTEDR